MRTGTCSQRRAPLRLDARHGDDAPVVAVSAGVVALWPNLLADLRAAGLSAVAAASARLTEDPAPGLVVLTQHDVDPREARSPVDAPGVSPRVAPGVPPRVAPGVPPRVAPGGPPRVVRVVPAGNRARYADALDQGAAGVVPDDAPAAQVVQALEAALRGQVLLPADVLREWLDRALGHGPAAD